MQNTIAIIYSVSEHMGPKYSKPPHFIKLSHLICRGILIFFSHFIPLLFFSIASLTIFLKFPSSSLQKFSHTHI